MYCGFPYSSIGKSVKRKEGGECFIADVGYSFHWSWAMDLLWNIKGGYDNYSIKFIFVFRKYSVSGICNKIQKKQ